MGNEASILWRRLDSPGHDACRLIENPAGWRLEGMAVFRLENSPACLTYTVACDAHWCTLEGTIKGWVGDRSVDLLVCRSDSQWRLNGEAVAGLEGCVDLDLGFTPATNLLPLRRVAPDVGQGADVAAAWLDVPEGRLLRLDQRYERLSESEYTYEAPQFGYAALLSVDATGFVTRYPGLWEAER